MGGAGTDLAYLATAAGLGGSAVATVAGIILFKGLIMRVLAQVVVTAVLTGVGFLALLTFMGYAIVPESEVKAAQVQTQTAEMPRGADGLVTTQSVRPQASPTPTEPPNPKKLVLKRPGG
jgi:hypothetical protein